ncbi:MAG: sulfatase-like hydrolase/transferase [Acidobacteria bacterium]|nr:sulfatase-like hydrolase/transferase [Acidobacteriota bacterium]
MSDKPAWLQAIRPFSRRQIESIDEFRRKQLQTLKPLDEAISDILTLLKEQGRLDQTLVVYISDNGLFWGENRIQQGKNRVYEPSIHVPFALRYPPLVWGPRVEPGLVANIDIAPTLYELSGIPIPPDVDGLSLVRLLAGTGEWRDALVIESWPNPPYEAIHTGRYVYVETQGDRPELYDLEVDPYQHQNAVDHPDYAMVVEELRDRLEQERARDAARPGVGATELEPEETEDEERQP